MSVTFTQKFHRQLYAAEPGRTDRGWVYFVLPRPSHEEAIPLDRALTELSGTFVFSTQDPQLSEQTAQQFVLAILQIRGRRGQRGMIWIKDRSRVVESATILRLVRNGSKVSLGARTRIAPSLELEIEAGMRLSLSEDGTTLRLGSASRRTRARIRFIGVASPIASRVTSGTLAFEGPLRGCIQFDVFLERQSLNDELRWGFQFAFPDRDTPGATVGEWLPLASGKDPAGADMLGFRVSVDPNDPFNESLDTLEDGDTVRDVPERSPRTFLAFTGRNSDGRETTLVSHYRTAFGVPVTLEPVTEPEAGLPACFVFNSGGVRSENAAGVQVAPDGDFVLHVVGAERGRVYDLMAGLQGTESFGFEPKTEDHAGDRLRFFSRRPAFAPNFPFEPAAPVGPPLRPDAKLLDDTYTTSWATIVRPPSARGGIPYVAQPKGAPLYGRDDLVFERQSSLLGAKDPSVIIPTSDLAFPLVPYAGFEAADRGASFSASQALEFERTIVGPTRRRIIGSAPATSCAPSRFAALQKELPKSASSFNATTPDGLIITIGRDGRWTKLLLGQSVEPFLHQLYLCNPGPELQQAFQTSQLFLVVANAAHLGALSGIGNGECDADPRFYNRINIEDWVLEANVGQANRYNDYNNLIIVKGRKGPLYDPTTEESRRDSLVSNPEKWTQRNAFASPASADDATPDSSQLVILSGWLQDFFQRTGDEPDAASFGKFNAIARDPNWTGILMLKMTIANFPPDLAGIAAGIAAPERFYAHHFAIETGQVENDPESSDIGLEHSSSMSGLIHYTDPDFRPPETTGTIDPVRPQAGAAYDFRVLSLKVLFENSAIKDFQSYAQIALNRLFDMPVSHMGTSENPYNAIVLRGSYQHNDRQPIYSLGSIGDSTFYFDSNIVNKIEITSAQMTTRDPGSDTAHPAAVSWFGLNGFIDYDVLESDKGAFDLFSFGNDSGYNLPGKGLCFSNLGLEMTVPVEQPSKREFRFVSDEIRFDPASSTPRDHSLFSNFALELEGLRSGTGDTPPSADRYLALITDVRLTGVDGGPWYGLRYRLEMGTPGDLAGKAGLTAYLLTAWAPGESRNGSYRALVGLELPGTGGGARLISLENVFKLSIGQMRLTYDEQKKSFLLMLTEIALKFLGMLKIPPAGSTLFYLFGNPESGGKPSGLGWYAIYRQDSSGTAAPPSQER